MAPYIVVSRGIGCPSIENSKCQSVGLAFNALAYDDLASPDGSETGLSREGVGVVTRVPSGVCAKTLFPSVERRETCYLKSNAASALVNTPSAIERLTVFSSLRDSSWLSSKTYILNVRSVTTNHRYGSPRDQRQRP